MASSQVLTASAASWNEVSSAAVTGTGDTLSAATRQVRMLSNPKAEAQSRKHTAYI